MPGYSAPNLTQTANGADIYLRTDPVPPAPGQPPLDTINGNLLVNGSVTLSGANTLNLGSGSYLVNQGSGATANILANVNSVASFNLGSTSNSSLIPLLVTGSVTSPKFVSGSSTVPGTIANGAYVFLTDFNTAISNLTRPVLCVLSFVGTITPVNPSGLPSVVQAFVLPPKNSGSGTGVVTIDGANVANLGAQFRFTAPGGAGARQTLVEVANGAGSGYTIDAGSTYTWTILC